MEDRAQGIGVAVEEGQLASEERPRLFPVRRRGPWIRAWRGLHDRGGTGGSCQSLGNVCQLFGGSLRDRDSTVAVDRRLNTPRSNSPSLGRGWRAMVVAQTSGKTEVIRRIERKSREKREREGFPALSVENSKRWWSGRGIDRFEFLDSRFFFSCHRGAGFENGYSSWNGRVSFQIYKNRIPVNPQNLTILGNFWNFLFSLVRRQIEI